MSEKPHIIITSSRFLNPVFSEYRKSHDTEGMWQSMTDEEVEQKAVLFSGLWEREKGLILGGITEALGLHFLENIICAYVVSGQQGGFSDPIVISSHLSDEKFVDVLLHELTHRLLQYHVEEINTHAITKKLFANVENPSTKAHIMINAVEQYLFLEVFRDAARLQRNINYMLPYPALNLHGIS